MRCDQWAGLPRTAETFLRENEIDTGKCECCQRPFPPKREVIGKYEGGWQTEYPLTRYTLTDGRTADEFVQASPWSSGPVFFFGLKVSDGQVFEWSEQEIKDNL